MSTVTKPSPRERLLEAALELFYAEGVQSVGIDRVIARAGVAKASLYSTFGSKEGLVHAYLEQRREILIGRLRRASESVDDPIERLLAVFDAQAKLFGRPDFHGCAFVAAAAEAPVDSQIARATAEYRGEVRELFARLAREAEIADPGQLADQLRMIYDGGSIAANLDRNPAIASPARAAARVLIEAAPRTTAGDDRRRAAAHGGRPARRRN
jgi:AcrR family transcriptional regulator